MTATEAYRFWVRKQREYLDEAFAAHAKVSSGPPNKKALMIEGYLRFWREHSDVCLALFNDRLAEQLRKQSAFGVMRLLSYVRAPTPEEERPSRRRRRAP